MNDPDRIAFVDEDGQIATVAADGRDLRQLTRGEAVFQFPAWSPDNSRLAAIGQRPRESSIAVVAADATSPHLADAPAARTIYTSQHEPPIYLSWSPNSRLVSWLSVHPELRLALYLLDADAATPTSATLLTSGQPCFWHWHGDSQGLFVHANLGQSTAQVAHIRWDTPSMSQVQAVDVRPGLFQAPGLASSGRYAAYAQITSAGVSQLLVASHSKTQIVAEYQGISAFNWSPSGERLAFLDPESTAHHTYGALFHWDAVREQVTQLTTDPVLAFFWAPNGQQIAYFTVASTPQRDRVTHIPTATNGHAKGAWPFAQTPPPQSVQLGLEVVDVTTASRQHLFAFSPSEPFLNQFLTFFDQYAKGHSIWSPDGSSLVLSSDVHGQPALQVVDVARNQQRIIANGYMAAWSW